MRLLYLGIVAALFAACGGSGGGGNTSPQSSELNGRYRGVLRGISCSLGEARDIEVTHDVEIEAREEGAPVSVVDDRGRMYEGAFAIIIRPEGNVHGFSVHRDRDGDFESPTAFSYNFAGLPSGRVYVSG